MQPNSLALHLKLSATRSLIFDIEALHFDNKIKYSAYRIITCLLFLTEPLSSGLAVLIFWSFIFTHVLVHELGHTLVWYLIGARTVTIKYKPNGGAHAVSTDPIKPSTALKILLYAAGPIADTLYASVLIVLLVFLVPKPNTGRLYNICIRNPASIQFDSISKWYKRRYHNCKNNRPINQGFTKCDFITKK